MSTVSFPKYDPAREADEAASTRPTLAVDPRLAQSQAWRTASIPTKPDRLAKNADAVWEYLAAQAAVRAPRRARFMRAAGRVVAMRSKYADLADAALDEALADHRVAIRGGRITPAARLDALAAVREAGRRSMGLEAYPVQLAAVLAMTSGTIAEMATGEGKTLTAGLLAVLHGWRGLGCHVVTVNDYLAGRDAEWLGPLFSRCGLTASAVVEETPPDARRAAYAADVTYATNKSLAADFLRDRLQVSGRPRPSSGLIREILGGEQAAAARPLMRGLEHAIVDEADSVLIDEAVTPLILSGSMPNDEQVAAFREAHDLAEQLREQADFRVDAKHREVRLTAAGRARLAELCRDREGVWSGARRAEELVAQALTARRLFIKEKQYVVQDGKVVIVDESTGRLMPDRTWRDGLHQAVEAKEGLEVQPPKGTLARVSFQRFFRMYRKLCGMTGTAAEARVELWRTYRLPVVKIPTHRPCIRKERPPAIFATGDARDVAVVERVEAEHRRGRPVLVGTRSIDASERLSGLLAERKVPHRVLNAVRHAEEAEVVKLAGQQKAVTIATNMAGRGTDIKLAPGVPEMGGLLVVAAELNDSRRVDRQLFGRAARQGDPGEAIGLGSLDDELFTRYQKRLAAPLRRAAGRGGVSAWLAAAARRLLRRAQGSCQRRGAASRRHVLRQDHELYKSLGFAAGE